MVKIAGVLLIVVVALWCVFGIKANASVKAENDKAEYQLQEIEFKKEVKDCLENMGYFNSGITVTKIMNEDGSREYSVRVHNQYLDLENTDAVNYVYSALSYIRVQGDNITVNYTIF